LEYRKFSLRWLEVEGVSDELAHVLAAGVEDLELFA